MKHGDGIKKQAYLRRDNDNVLASVSLSLLRDGSQAPVKLVEYLTAVRGDSNIHLCLVASILGVDARFNCEYHARLDNGLIVAGDMGRFESQSMPDSSSTPVYLAVIIAPFFPFGAINGVDIVGLHPRTYGANYRSGYLFHHLLHLLLFIAWRTHCSCTAEVGTISAV